LSTIKEGIKVETKKTVKAPSKAKKTTKTTTKASTKAKKTVKAPTKAKTATKDPVKVKSTTSTPAKTTPKSSVKVKKRVNGPTKNKKTSKQSTLTKKPAPVVAKKETKTPKDKTKENKKVKRLKDPAKVKRAKKITAETAFISIILFFAIFTDKIPYFKDSDFSDVIASTIGKFFDVSSIVTENYLKILESFTIIIFVWVLNRLVSIITKLIFGKKKKSSAKIILFNSFTKYIIVFLGFFFILSAWGVETSTILASIGLLGLAISFGAQGLIEDLLSGLFIIFENQFEVGDIVYVGDFRGIVYEMGLRSTKFMDQYTLDVKIMRNSSVKDIINASVKLSVAICDVGIAYDTDLNKIEKLSKKFLPTLLDKYPKTLYDAPVYLGVQKLSDSSVVVRFIGKTTEEKKVKLVRILNYEIKTMFDKNKITIPFPQIDVHNSNK
jgi:small conductance mechanosensitive channel